MAIIKNGRLRIVPISVDDENRSPPGLTDSLRESGIRVAGVGLRAQGLFPRLTKPRSGQPRFQESGGVPHGRAC
ncbi:MAG: hypothetical protein WAM21_17960, partial [Steroidobacteraceae bacterium]